MNKQLPITAVFYIATALLTVGCGEDNDHRLVEQAERHEQRQASQNKQALELQREVAAGTRHLVEADAKARAEIASIQALIQSERNEIGRQRDQLEEERRAIASSRRFDSLLAAAVANASLLLACLLPLGLAWLQLRRTDEPDSGQVVVETLLADLASTEPCLLVRGPSGDSPKTPRLSDRQNHHHSNLSDEEEL